MHALKLGTRRRCEAKLALRLVGASCILFPCLLILFAPSEALRLMGWYALLALGFHWGVAALFLLWSREAVVESRLSGAGTGVFLYTMPCVLAPLIGLAFGVPANKAIAFAVACGHAVICLLGSGLMFHVLFVARDPIPAENGREQE